MISVLSILGYFLAVFATIVLFLVNKVYLKPRRLLSYYKSQGMHTDYVPPLGHMTRIKTDFRDNSDSFYYSKVMARTKPDIPLRAINFGDNVMIALNSPEVLKEFFRNQQIYAKYSYFIKPLRLVCGLGILTSEGSHWKKHRKILSNFFNFNFFVDNVPTIRDVVVEFFDELKNSPKNVHIMDEVQALSGEIIGRLFFSEKLHHIKMKLTGRPVQLELAYLISDLSSEARNLLPVLLGSGIIAKGIFKKHRDILDRRDEMQSLLTSLIYKRREGKGPQKNDLLDLMLKTQQDPNPENSLSDQDIVDEFLTFIAAGMDTTGHLFTMALYSLELHPEVLPELKAEIAQYYNSETVDNESLRKMDYMTAFIKEVLRFYSPVPAPMPMEATETHTLGGGKYTIKKGTVIRPDYFFNNFNSKYFADPDTFNPKRWFEKEVTSLDPYIYIPFSSGSRNCIGQHLAMIEAKIMLSEFLNRYDYKCSVQNYNPKLLMRMLYEPVPDYFIDITPNK